MKFLSYSLLAFIVLVLLAVGLTTKIPPASIGVKQVQVGPGKGVIEEDFSTGLVLSLPSYHIWHLFPRQTHFLHFTGGARIDDRRISTREIEDWRGPLQLRTSDNNNVELDVSVTYKIIRGSAYRLVQDGLRVDYVDRVRSLVLDVLRTELAKLTSEDLQLTDTRTERAQLTLNVLREKLAQFHVEPEDILIRAVSFQADYEDKLQNKQLLRQQSKLEEALTAQAEEDQKVQTQKRQIGAAVLAKERDWEKKIQEKKSDFEVQIATIDSEAQLYDQKTRAEGISERDILIATGELAIEKSKALRDELRNSALDSAGGRILLALEAVKNLEIPEVILNSDDPSVPMLLDMGRMTRLLVGEATPPPNLKDEQRDAAGQKDD